MLTITLDSHLLKKVQKKGKLQLYSSILQKFQMYDNMIIDIYETGCKSFQGPF